MNYFPSACFIRINFSKHSCLKVQYVNGTESKLTHLRTISGIVHAQHSFGGKWVLSIDHLRFRINTVFGNSYVNVEWIFPHFLDKKSNYYVFEIPIDQLL